MAAGEPPAAPGGPEQLELVRDELRFELGLLHERVNALVAAEAFLTIAFTAAMSNGAPGGERFSAVVGPVLAVLGLLLALLAWPGIDATARLVLAWTARRSALLRADPALASTVWGIAAQGRGEGRAGPDQWRSMLFFRAAPALFAVVWAGLAVFAVAHTR